MSSFTVSLNTNSKYRLFNCLFSYNRIKILKKLIEFFVTFIIFPAGVVPYFEFYEGENGSQDKTHTNGWDNIISMCRIHYTEMSKDDQGLRKVNKKKMTKTYGCPNDDARSMKVCYAKQGTRIFVFDDGKNRFNKDDWAVIDVKKDMEGCETISHFEETKDYTFLSVSYMTEGNLNGKISSFTIEEEE